MVFILSSCVGYGRFLPSSSAISPLAMSFDVSRRHAHCALTEQRHRVDHIRQKLRRQTELSSGNSFEGLIMIDHIQRLGIDHHFREEIRDALDKQYVECYVNGINGQSAASHDQLHQIALRFRLLRQQGYHISPDIFEKFKDGKGKFEGGLRSNVEGLMSLFEASYMSMEGEDILDEANAFCGKLLQNLHKPRPDAVDNTLKNPYHKSLAKFMAMDFLPNLECRSEGWLHELGELAKMDFDVTATTYNDGFLHFSRWWEALGLGKELKLARDQPLKWFIWAVAALPDPDFSKERIEITKPISLIYIVDDLFDVYGELNDLSHFTKAINRWELAAVEELPEYMRSTWRAIFDTTNEISHKIWIKHGWNPTSSLQKAWADFCNASLVEARWNDSGYLPTTEEYLKIGTVTSGVPMVLCHGFYLLAESLDTKMARLLNDDPRIISSVAMILRLSDDLGSAKDEGQNGYDGSYLKCYMNKNNGVSIETTRQHVHGMIADAWKSLNKDCLHLYPHPFSSSHNFGRACLNSARMVPLMYNYKHSRLPGFEKFLKLLGSEN